MTDNDSAKNNQVLKEQMIARSNLATPGRKIISTYNRYRNYAAYSTYLGNKTAVDFDFAVQCNLLYYMLDKKLPMVRQDQADLVYKNERGKFRAVIEEVADCYERGQPVLVGTVSVEKSEVLAAMLRKKNIPHTVLNAKHHAREAAIVAQAGKSKQVTIATNMAGRGTDIQLGGNAEYRIKGWIAAGGPVVRSRTLRTASISESAIADRLGVLGRGVDGLSLAFLPGIDGVDLRLTSTQFGEADTERRLTAAKAKFTVLSDEELMGQATVMFIAGHETTAFTLCWTLLLLAQHPRELDRVSEEVRTVLGDRALLVFLGRRGDRWAGEHVQQQGEGAQSRRADRVSPLGRADLGVVCLELVELTRRRPERVLQLGARALDVGLLRHRVVREALLAHSVARSVFSKEGTEGRGLDLVAGLAMGSGAHDSCRTRGSCVST